MMHDECIRMMCSIALVRRADLCKVGSLAVSYLVSVDTIVKFSFKRLGVCVSLGIWGGA